MLDATRVLRRKPRPIWNKILERLPKAAIVEEQGRKMIGLWDGLVLGEVQGLTYERGALRWGEQSLPAEPVDQHSMGSVYRIGGGGQ